MVQNLTREINSQNPLNRNSTSQKIHFAYIIAKKNQLNIFLLSQLNFVMYFILILILCSNEK